ncbi:hybrid sensor histidine kinase/response regulator transcription factor [Cyclobacterium salsum]|uniref:hybrid sensor histidine kinase/response regulator transcription factor n=1 Tax=Cyclobacterium salsum TaxID=2666329 RepID=UPI00139206FD|nr:hybrid sensor histidine kinase/response regulator transcription factor [Cyclobacterium salsum]
MRLSQIIMSGMVLSFSYPVHSQSNPFTFERFTTEQGLPSNFILDIVQGHQGYIWIATEDGLARYNGYEFAHYSHIPGDSSSLSENRVEKLYVDVRGNLWVRSSTNLDRFDPVCNCFISYTAKLTQASSDEVGQINAFSEDHENNLWIGTQNGGVFCYERESDRFRRILNDPNDQVNVLNDEVRVLMVDSKNQLWIGTGEPFNSNGSGGGIIRHDLKTGHSRRFLHEPGNENSLIDNRVSALFEDLEGKLWVGTCQSGLHYFESNREEFIRLLPGDHKSDGIFAPQGEMGQWASCAHVKFIFQDHQGNFWVGNYNGGINHFDPVSGKLTTYKHDPSDPGSLNSNQVWSFFQDRQDRYWIGNLPGGLHKIDPSRNKFDIYQPDSAIPNSLSADHVLGIYESRENPDIIWIGTRGGGLNRLNVTNGRFKHFRHEPDRAFSISSDIVWTAYEDSNGTFWVGTEAGLDTLDRTTGRFNDFKLPENENYSNITNPVIRMHEDRKGRLWLGTWSGGIIRLSADRKSYKKYDFSDSNHQSYFNSVYDIHENNEGTIWVAIFQGGLFRYDEVKDEFVPHLEAYGATCILEKSSGKYWTGTSSSGLICYDANNDTIAHFTTKDGLSSNTVLGILEDEKGLFWLSTGNGIVKFNPETLDFLPYGMSDGLSINSFSHTSAFKSTDGQMFFGGDGGLVSFYPEQIAGNPYPPDLVLSGLQVAGTSVDFREELNSPDDFLTLSHQQNDLTFDYVALHYTDPSKNLYKYKMENYDPEWIVAGTQRTARYTNLDPGQYTFQVIAGSSDGVWNETGTSLTFYITPPWWTRWWAYTLFAGILLVFARWFYKFKVSRKLAVAESRRLTEIDHFKSNLYTNITHEFRTPLTVILGLTDTLRSKAGNHRWEDTDQRLEMIQRNGKNLLQLVNKMLDLAKLESGHLELEMLQKDVVPFIKYICESFESMAREKQIKLDVDAQVGQLVMDFDPAKLAMIVSNLLSNAIKFTPDHGQITVHLNQIFGSGTSYFTLIVNDNGKGLQQEEIPYVFDRFYQADQSSTRHSEGTGIGLTLTKELVELMGGTIKVESPAGMGSTFTVQLPITLAAPKATEQDLSQFFQPSLPYALKDIDEKAQDLDLPLVLIIEDNLDVANYLKMALKNKYHCLHALNGQTGLELAYAHIPDIIICDVMMPGMDGFEVCATLKADKRSDHIPIIMLTALAEKEARLTGLSKGADAYLAKPFDKTELLIRLEKLLETRKRLQQKYSRRFLSSEPGYEPISSSIESFLVKVERVILEHLGEEDFSVDHLADAISLSRSQVHRKIKAITGYSTSIYIRMIRLEKAKELLTVENLTIAEVAYRVGFKSPVYFSQIFRKTFGESPSESRN